MKADRPVIVTNGVPYLQIRSVESHSTSGREVGKHLDKSDIPLYSESQNNHGCGVDSPRFHSTILLMSGTGSTQFRVNNWITTCLKSSNLIKVNINQP